MCDNFVSSNITISLLKGLLAVGQNEISKPLIELLIVFEISSKRKLPPEMACSLANS